MAIQVSPEMEYVKRRESEMGVSSQPPTTQTYVQAPAPTQGVTTLSEADRQRMAAASAGQAAASASAAAGTAGQATESANANAMATASDAAAKPASAPAPAPAAAVAPVSAPPTALDSSVNDYLTKTAANLGSPSYVTDAGKTYADIVTKSLTAPDASSVNAQNTQDTAAARNAYLARVAADERVGQSGFALGSAQATRIADQSQAGVNAANQAGQNAVNDYIRQRTELNLNRARGLESDQQAQNQTNLNNVQNQSAKVYSRGRDAVGDARYENETNYSRSRDAIGDTRYADETAYGRSRDAIGDTRYADETAYGRGRDAVGDARTARLDAISEQQRAFENSQVIKNGTDADKRNLLNSLPEGPAKNAANTMLAQGKTVAEVMAAIFNPDGSVVEAYRGKSTVALGQEAIKEKAIATLQTEAQANGTMFDPNTPEGVRAVAAKMMELQKTVDAPIADANKAAAVQSATEKLNTGAPLTEAETETLVKSGEIKSFGTEAAVPTDIGTMRGLVGKPIRIGTEDYQVVSADSVVTSRTWLNQPRHTDYMVLKSSDGETVYSWGGALHDSPPNEGPATRIGPLTTE